MGFVNQRQIVVAHAGRVRAVGPGFQLTDPLEAQDLGPEHSRFIHVADIEHDRVQPHGHDDRKPLFAPGNQLWHSDSSYQKVPARYSLLNAHVLRPGGGDTHFADMRAVYDIIDIKMKPRIEGLICEPLVKPARNRCSCRRMRFVASDCRHRKRKACWENGSNTQPNESLFTPARGK